MNKPIKLKLSFILILAILLQSVVIVRAQNQKVFQNQFTTEILGGEFWWGGLSVDGIKMPYSETNSINRDLWGNNGGNQAQPLLISNNGRFIWSEQPFSYTIENGKITVRCDNCEIQTGQAGNTLKEVYLYASKTFFPSNGKIPHPLLFSAPQYNTWIELMYDQNEADILKYAQSIIDNGFPPGVLMIDDNWQEDYGQWNFSCKRFSDPKGMIEKLHRMGFMVMVWICPFVSADSETFRYLAKEGMLILDEQKNREILWKNTQNKAAIIRWWNGASAVLDLSNPKTVKWFKGELNRIVNDYGVDGFKFDAGDAEFYTNNVVSFKKSNPNEHSEYFAKIGLDYPMNEYRASWKMAGMPLVQRLRDKNHRWEDLQQLIPGILAQGLMGYAFTCPDMIGGGEFQSFLNAKTIDEELVVRSAQIHALMPMMQFSVAPWRVLNKQNLEICRKMAELHVQMGETILELAKESSKTGEPIARSLAYNYPGKNYETVNDQFMLGEAILVAPIVEKGKTKRKVVFPEGKWKGDDGTFVEGPKTINIDVPLDRLPYYIMK